MKLYVYIQNGMYGRVVRLPCTYVQFLWTTRKFSEQVVYGTNTYGQLFWTTRPFLKYRGTYGTEEVRFCIFIMNLQIRKNESAD